MYIITLLVLYIILSNIYFTKLKISIDVLKIKYDELKFKYDSKKWVGGFMDPLVHGMIAGFSTRH